MADAAPGCLMTSQATNYRAARGGSRMQDYHSYLVLEKETAENGSVNICGKIVKSEDGSRAFDEGSGGFPRMRPFSSAPRLSAMGPDPSVA